MRSTRRAAPRPASRGRRSADSPWQFAYVWSWSRSGLRLRPKNGGSASACRVRCRRRFANCGSAIGPERCGERCQDGCISRTEALFFAIALAHRTDHDGVPVWQAARAAGDAVHARRLRAIAAAYDGMSRADAAKVGSMDRQTLRNWVHRLNAARAAWNRLIDSPRTIMSIGLRQRAYSGQSY